MVPVHRHLSPGRGLREQANLQLRRINGQVLERGALEHRDPDVDPFVQVRFLMEATHRIVVARDEVTERRPGAYRRHGGEPTVLNVERAQVSKVDVAQHVGIGDDEPIAQDVW